MNAECIQGTRIQLETFGRTLLHILNILTPRILNQCFTKLRSENCLQNPFRGLRYRSVHGGDWEVMQYAAENSDPYGSGIRKLHK